MQHSRSTILRPLIVIIVMTILLTQCGVKLPPKAQHEQSGPLGYLRNAESEDGEEDSN